MQIAIITVQRTPMYLYDTLDSLLASCPIGQPIDIFIGTLEATEICARIDTYRRERPGCRLFVHHIPPHLWTLIEPLPPKLRAVGNFVNALTSANVGDVMLFEDDIKIKLGWIKALETDDVIWGDRSIAYDAEHAFVSLYYQQDIRHLAPPNREAAMLRKPIVDFYGTLGLFVPEAHREALAKAALVHLRPNDPRPVEQRWPFDEIVKMYVNEHKQCNLVVTIPSYVDHIGTVSVINPTHGPRRAPMF